LSLIDEAHASSKKENSVVQDFDWKYIFTSTEGRINRQRWWIGMLALFLVGAVSGFLFGHGGLMPFVIGILILLAGICMHVKRCHDRNKSGWWCLLLLVPGIGPLWALIDLGLLEGTRGSNRYGPDPLIQIALQHSGRHPSSSF
jgi:uncharacterized membrane protein YhaH (DUF805 family)